MANVSMARCQNSRSSSALTANSAGREEEWKRWWCLGGFGENRFAIMTANK